MLPRLPRPSLQRGCTLFQTAAVCSDHWGMSHITMEGWPGRALGACKTTEVLWTWGRSIRLGLGKNQKPDPPLRWWPAWRNSWWWRKKLSGDWNKMEQAQALGDSWTEGVMQQGEISAVFAFTVVLKRRNLRLNRELWLIPWLVK